MNLLLHIPLFRIGTAAMAAATAAVAALFVYALDVPTQPLGPGWRMTVIAAEDSGPTSAEPKLRLGAGAR